jgi:Spy/CpxP family protein refolding chaperone
MRRVTPPTMEIVMTDINKVPLRPEPPIRESQQKGGKSGGSAWPRTVAMVGVLACGVALGAGGLAAAAGMDHMAWRGARLAFLQHAVAHALDSVGANAAQEAKVHDIIAAKFAEISPKPDDHEAMRKQALDLLTAPTIDRAAVEHLRTEVVAAFDAKSKAVVGGLLDVADQLTPQQRTQLGAELADMAQHGAGMGPWGRWRHGPAMDGAPDNAPAKD